jgi:hypothetical protein
MSAGLATDLPLTSLLFQVKSNAGTRFVALALGNA